MGASMDTTQGSCLVPFDTSISSHWLHDPAILSHDNFLCSEPQFPCAGVGIGQVAAPSQFVGGKDAQEIHRHLDRGLADSAPNEESFLGDQMDGFACMAVEAG
eukprot:gene21351-28288_t